jgi:hypothetical protein
MTDLSEHTFAIEIIPVFNDGPFYYRTVVSYAWHTDGKTETELRDIFHCDTLERVLDVMKSWYVEGGYAPK